MMHTQEQVKPKRATPPTPYIYMLGLTQAKLSTILGEPFGRYYLHGREILMFSWDSGTLTCELEDGFTVRINSHEERRTAARVTPQHEKSAFLRHGSCRHKARIVDLSVKSVCLTVSDGCLPQKGELVTFCTGLQTRISTLVYVNLAGYVHSVKDSERKVVILLHTPYETHSYRALVDYVNIQIALTSIQHVTTPICPPLSLSSEIVSTEFLPSLENLVIHSDLCPLCEERACGLSSPPHPIKSEKAPKHKGLVNLNEQ